MRGRAEDREHSEDELEMPKERDSILSRGKSRRAAERRGSPGAGPLRSMPKSVQGSDRPNELEGPPPKAKAKTSEENLVEVVFTFANDSEAVVRRTLP